MESQLFDAETRKALTNFVVNFLTTVFDDIDTEFENGLNNEQDTDELDVARAMIILRKSRKRVLEKFIKENTPPAL